MRTANHKSLKSQVALLSRLSLQLFCKNKEKRISVQRSQFAKHTISIIAASMTESRNLGAQSGLFISRAWVLLVTVRKRIETVDGGLCERRKSRGFFSFARVPSTSGGRYTCRASGTPAGEAHSCWTAGPISAPSYIPMRVRGAR